MSEEAPRIVPYGDHALLVILGDRVDVELNRRVHLAAEAVVAAGWPRPVPAYASLMVSYDPTLIDEGVAIERLAAVLRTAPLQKDAAPLGPRKRLLEIPVRYGGMDGPDLDDVARLHDLTPRQVIELHTSTTYHVFMLGFCPGFGYLGPLPPELVTPRRASPRPRVPAGSVGIAGNQTGVYPVEIPGGWQLIGRTTMRLWDVNREPPAVLAPGDEVVFVPDRR